MKKILASLVLIGSSLFSYSQNVGIGTNTPHVSAALEIQDTSKGILIPRMTMVQRNAIQNPAEGLMVYQTDSTRGFWYFSNNSWANFRNSETTLFNNNQRINGYHFVDTTLLFSYFEALSFCSNFTSGGFNDWRLPSVEDMNWLIMRFGKNIFPNYSGLQRVYYLRKLDEFESSQIPIFHIRTSTTTPYMFDAVGGGENIKRNLLLVR
jgi:hypothetical protein